MKKALAHIITGIALAGLLVVFLLAIPLYVMTLILRPFCLAFEWATNEIGL